MSRLAPWPLKALTLAAQSFLDTPLMVSANWLDSPAVVGGDRDWTWRQVHSASVALAERLNGVTMLGNLCNTHSGFLITWLAALRRGCVQWLPPSGGQADLTAMLAPADDKRVVVTDTAVLQQPWAAQICCIVHDSQGVGFDFSDTELAWSPAWDLPLVRLFTSGSTGVPEPKVKSLGQLALGAQILAARLQTEIDGGIASIRRIVSSVPPQHMFGLEASVMMSAIHGIPLDERRPLLPADVFTVFEGGVDETVWVATPLHLRALVQADERVGHCSAAIASTMPLASTLAAQAEGLIRAPVLELYGSTETGALAMRRTACDSGWRALQGVRLESTTQGTLAWGEHFQAPQTLGDEIEFDSSGGFKLLGRNSDLVKIAGRRASLAGLNLLLSDLPGHIDAVFYLPASGSPTERMVLIHAGASLDRGSIEAWLRERIDSVFLPRTVIRVDHLPRTASGKLPRAALDDIFNAWLSSKTPR